MQFYPSATSSSCYKGFTLLPLLQSQRGRCCPYTQHTIPLTTQPKPATIPKSCLLSHFLNNCTQLSPLLLRFIPCLSTQVHRGRYLHPSQPPTTHHPNITFYHPQTLLIITISSTHLQHPPLDTKVLSLASSSKLGEVGAFNTPTPLVFCHYP